MRDLDQLTTITDGASRIGGDGNSVYWAARRLGIQVLIVGRERLIPRASLPAIAAEIARYMIEHRRTVA
jgi:hypothetical protein